MELAFHSSFNVCPIVLVPFHCGFPFHSTASRFQSSNHESDLTSLEEYVERMKEKQEHMYFMSAPSRQEAEASPFVERLLKKGYEIMYLVDPVDEYCVQNLPEFEGKKFQNVAKEGLQFGDEGEREKEKLEELEENFKPLTAWLKDTALKEVIDKAVVSNRLTDSPCALVASQYGWYVSDFASASALDMHLKCTPRDILLFKYGACY